MEVGGDEDEGGVGVLDLEGELGAGVEGVGGGKDGAEGEDGEGEGGEVEGVWGEEEDDVTVVEA